MAVVTYDNGRVVPLSGAGIFNTCALHGLSNCQNTSAAGKAAVVPWANSATEEEQAARFEELKVAVGEIVAQKVADRSEDITFLAAQKRGLLTNMKQSTSNAVEQQHSKDAVVRSQPPGHAVRTFLSDTQMKLSKTLLTAQEDMKAGHEVVPKILGDIRAQAKDMTTGWKARVVGVAGEDHSSISFTVTSPHGSVTYPVTLRAGEIMDESPLPYDVPLPHDGKLRWYHRTVCACRKFLVLGHPCQHAAFCLLLLRHWVDEFNEANKGRRVLKMSPARWDWRGVKFYHEEYHLERIKLQCSGGTVPVHVPENIRRVQLFPPNIKHPVSRRKVRRMIVAPKTKKSSDNAEQDKPVRSVPAGSSLSLSDQFDSLVGLGAGPLPAAPLLSSALAEWKPGSVCHGCGQPGHNIKRCIHKTTPYVVKYYTGLKKLLTLPTLDDEAWKTLNAKPWDVSEVAGPSLTCPGAPLPPSPGELIRQRWVSLQERVEQALARNDDESGDGDDTPDDSDSDGDDSDGVGGDSVGSEGGDEEVHLSPERQRQRVESIPRQQADAARRSVAEMFRMGGK